jgi:hypothetical protein
MQGASMSKSEADAPRRLRPVMQLKVASMAA